MAINIGTNINYQGHKFLDERQGLANSESDLKNWSIPVPSGFEAFVNGSWYIYDENNEFSETTGYFKKRRDEELNAQVELNTSDIEELMNEVFKLSFKSISGGGTYEVGETITPTISWSLNYKEKEVSPTAALVNDKVSGINSDFNSYTGAPITSTTTYNVKAFYNKLSCEKSISYNFKYKKYFGVSEKTTLTNEDVQSFSSTWADSWTMGATNFDCTGGKYPYYLIPSNLYNANTFKLWVGGFRNTDLEISTLTITKYNKEYTVIRLGTLQTGVLSIEFK